LVFCEPPHPVRASDTKAITRNVCFIGSLKMLI